MTNGKLNKVAIDVLALEVICHYDGVMPQTVLFNWGALYCGIWNTLGGGFTFTTSGDPISETLLPDVVFVSR